MSSVKNLFVIVLLMGVSYGAFQVINAPDPFLKNAEEANGSLDIDDAMPRIEDDSVMNDPVSPQPYPKASVETVPKLPPMESSELSVPDLDMPELEMSAPAPLKDPAALAQQELPAMPSNIEAPPQTGDGFEAPNLVPPAPAPGLQQSGGGQFAVQPQTDMQPITPPAATEQAMEQAEGLAQRSTESLDDAASQFITQGQQLLDNEVIQPTQDASQMIDNAAVEMTNRADQLVENVQGQYEQAMNDAAGQFAPPTAAPVASPPRWRPGRTPGG